MGYQVLYKFFEKTMATNLTIQKDTAMPDNAKMQSLSNDCTRRMLTTSEAVEMETRCQIVDDYAQTLATIVDMGKNKEERS